MAVAIIGGVTVSTLLTLVVVPCAYLAFVPLENKDLYRKFLPWMRDETTDKTP